MCFQSLQIHCSFLSKSSVSPVHCGTTILLWLEKQSRANKGIRIPQHPNSAFPSVSSLLNLVRSTRKHLPTQDGTKNPSLPILTGEEPSVGGLGRRTWQAAETTSKGRTQCSEMSRIPKIPHPPQRSPKESVRRRRRARPLRLFLWGRGRRSLAPFQPVPRPARDQLPTPAQGDLCYGRRAAPSLPVPVPLELRHPPVYRTTTAFNWPFWEIRTPPTFTRCCPEGTGGWLPQLNEFTG